ncbi:hypothetical protein GJ496_002216, partial [Pomphorhynchus laevis]
INLHFYGWSQLTPLLNTAQEHINFGINSLFSQNIIYPVFNLPYFGETLYYPELLSNYIHLALLKAPNSIFSSDNTVTDTLKLHPEIATFMLKKHICVMSITGFILSPLICLYKLLDNFYKHTEVIRQNPRLFSKRVWTKYGRIVLRNFNELDHELDQRLYDAYNFTNDYLDSSVNYTNCAIFRFIASISGCFAAILFVISILSSHFSNQLIIPITAFGIIYKIFMGLLPCERVHVVKTTAPVHWC